MYKYLIIPILLLSLSSNAQVPNAGGRPVGMNGQNMNIGRFYGRIQEANSNKGIQAASVQLIGSKFDTVSKKKIYIKQKQDNQIYMNFSFESRI